jgi:hypothetical protein
MGHPIAARFHPPSAVETALYVYAFFLALNVFRYLYSYSRWVFAKIELSSEKSAAGKHRTVWAALTIGILRGHHRLPVHQCQCLPCQARRRARA